MQPDQRLRGQCGRDTETETSNKSPETSARLLSCCLDSVPPCVRAVENREDRVSVDGAPDGSRDWPRDPETSSAHALEPGAGRTERRPRTLGKTLRVGQGVKCIHRARPCQKPPEAAGACQTPTCGRILVNANNSQRPVCVIQPKLESVVWGEAEYIKYRIFII